MQPTSNIFKDYLKMKLPLLGQLLLIIFGLVALLTTAYFLAEYSYNYALYLLLSILALPAVYLMIQYPKIWIQIILLSSFVLFIQSEEEFDIKDALLGLANVVFIVVWMLYSIGFKRRRLVFNIGDFFILFLFIVLAFNSVIAYINHVDLFDWAREYANMTILLYYFPIRHYFTEKRDLNRLLIMMAISIFISALSNFYMYYDALTSQDVVYAFQLSRGIRFNQTLFTFASITGFILAFSQKSKKREIFIVLLTIVYVAALVLSLSRTFWVILLLMIVVMFFFLPGAKKILLLIYTSIIIVLFTGAVLFFAKDDAMIFANAMLNRFTSLGQGSKDDSYKSRLAEYTAVWRNVKRYPLGGNGLARSFTYYEPTPQISLHLSVVHNGYLNFLYRWGFPLTLVYFVVFFYYLLSSIFIIINTKDQHIRTISMIGFGNLIMLLMVNLTSSQFTYRDGIFVTMFCFMFISIAEKLRDKELADGKL